jgi:hypothetical protein
MVTVSSSGSPELIREAKARATVMQVPYFDRRKNSGLSKHLGVEADAFLVLGSDGWKLTDSQGSLGFSPNLAMLRLKRFDKGERDDVMVRLGELGEGDRVLDCTLGLAADAMVAARAVGRNGRVVGLEKSGPLWALISSGLETWSWHESARIEALEEDYATALTREAAKSFDVVMFDPMFERETKSSPSFEVLRRYAHDDRLTPEVLERAREVARRWVLVKAARYSPALRRLGLTPEQSSRSAPTVWARVAAK